MNKKKATYPSPTVEVFDVCAESIICASGENVTVTNPWYGNVEDEF